MARGHGERTVQIARILRDNLKAATATKRYGDVQVRYDHGDSSDFDVCQPTSYMGRRYGTDATLSGVDIVLLKNKQVFLAIEVEESSVRPKLVLGDVFGVLLAKRLQIQGNSYPINDAVLIVAVTGGILGRQIEKYRRLERLLAKFLADAHTSANRPNIRKVRILVCSPDDLVRRVERLARLEVGKSLKIVGTPASRSRVPGQTLRLG